MDMRSFKRTAAPAPMSILSRPTCGLLTVKLPPATRETGNNRIGLIPEFVLPGEVDFRFDDHVTDFPIVGGFHSDGRALGIRVLIVEF